MDFFSVLKMVGGLALFLYGMHIMGDGLEKLSGGKLEQILAKLTSNPFKAVALGALVTAIIQSSSATTVMVVGFVNSGIIKLSQSIGIIMGANIGTTITSWILALSGIEGDSFFIKMLKPSSFSPILALIGVILIMFTKKKKKQDIGMILVGFAILMTGMDNMSAAVKPLADVPEFTNILLMFSNPILGMAAGAILTAVIQSSSASVGILQALCATGAVSVGTALPIIMGQNIGTCVTAMISSIGASKNAKRAACVHLYFNLVGTIVLMVVFYSFNTFIHFEVLETIADGSTIATIHTSFNIIATLMLLPFSKLLEKLACLTIKEDKTSDNPITKGEEALQLLDSRFLEAPAYAVEQCKNVSVKMAQLSQRAFVKAMELVEHYDENKAKEVVQLEDLVDRYEDQLGSYLVKLSGNDLSENDSRTLSMLLHCTADIERISDHAVNVQICAEGMNEKKKEFSEQAREELKIFSEALKDILNLTVTCMEQNDRDKAKEVEPLEEVIDDLNAELKARHVNRLRQGICTVDMGMVLNDITSAYERVADHCSNLAACFVQLQENGIDTHEYYNEVKDGLQFKNMYQNYKKAYNLPASK